MAINFTRGGRAPRLIGLAIAALLGSGLYSLCGEDFRSQEARRGARREILALSANEEAVEDRLAQQQQQPSTPRSAKLPDSGLDRTRSNQARTASDQARERSLA